jgi:hypothetical protein
MADFVLKRPSTALMIGQGIAQGTANFMSGIQQARALQAQREQQAAMNALRQQQLELQKAEYAQKYGPVTVDIQQLQTLHGMKEGGIDVPAGVESKVWNSFLENSRQAPEVLGAIQQGVAQTSRTKALGQYGGLPTMTKAEALGQPVRDMSAPYQQQGAATPDEAMARASGTMLAPQPRPGQVQMSRATYDLYKQGENAAAQERIWGMRNQTQLQRDAAQADSKESLVKLQGEIDAKLKEIENRGKLGVANVGAGSRVKSAQIGAGARVESAQISATARASKANSPANLDRKSINKQIEIYQKSLADLRKPNQLTGIAPPAAMIAESENYYNQQLSALQAKLNNMGPEAPATSQTTSTPAYGPGAAPKSGLPIRWDGNPSTKPQVKPGDIIEVTGGKSPGRYQVGADGKSVELVK